MGPQRVSAHPSTCTCMAVVRLFTFEAILCVTWEALKFIALSVHSRAVNVGSCVDYGVSVSKILVLA